MRLHPDLLRRADRLSKLLNCTRSAVIIQATREGLKKLERTSIPDAEAVAATTPTSVFD